MVIINLIIMFGDIIAAGLRIEKIFYSRYIVNITGNVYISISDYSSPHFDVSCYITNWIKLFQFINIKALIGQINEDL